MFPQRDNSTVGFNLDLDLLGPLDNEPVKRLPVRRNLFGTPKSDQQAANFLLQEDRLREQDNRKRFMEAWSFDVINGKPVQGSKFQYEQVYPKDNIPQFYFKTYPPSKSRPVPSSRRERSNTAPYYNRSRSSQCIPHRSLKRGPISRIEDNEENKFLTDVDLDLDLNPVRRVPVDAQSLLTTPKLLRSSSPLPSPSSLSGQSVDATRFPTSSNKNSPSTYSTLELRSPSVSNNSSGFTTVSNGSFRQQTITDHFQVKRPRCSSKSLPRT